MVVCSKNGALEKRGNGQLVSLEQKFFQMLDQLIVSAHLKVRMS